MLANTKLEVINNDFYSKRNVEKRNGAFVSFDLKKIKIAIGKAIDATFGKLDIENNKFVLTEILNIVVEKINNTTSENIHIEDIQDLILISMIELGYHDVYKVYKDYRRSKEKERKQFNNRTIKMMNSYLDKDTWEIKENANMSYSLQGLNLFLTSNLSKLYWIEKVFNKEDSKFHSSGDIHIHDLYNLSAYCCGWDLKDLLQNGFTGCEGKLSCYPPRHFDAAIGQIYNFLYTTQGEVAGAVSFSNVDTLLAPYIRKDNLLKNKSKFRQSFQNLIYNLNVPTRVGFQCVSEDTEILTQDGWKTYDQMTMTDMIATRNMTTGEIEYLQIEALSIYNHTGIMYRFKNSNMDQLVNENHKCVTYNADLSTYPMTYAKDLFKTLSDTLSSKAFPHAVMDGTGDVVESISHEDVDDISIIYDYEGVIWCPSTANGTMFARRNGTTFLTGNSPFTNFSLDLTCPEHMKNESVFIDGEDTKTVYGDYQEEINAFNDMFCEIMMEGDKNKNIFTFPIPTYEIDETFDWDNPALCKLWQMTGKYGIPYFGNYINSDASKEDFRSMCPIHGDEYVLIKDDFGELVHTKIKELNHNEIYDVYSDGKFVKGRFQIYPDQPMLDVTLVNGHSVVIAEDHLNFALDDANSEDIKEIVGKDLQPGMSLPYSNQSYGLEHGTYDLGYLVGIFAGSGNISNDQETIFSSIGISKVQIIDNIIYIIQKFFGASYRTKDRNDSISLITDSKAVKGLCSEFVSGINSDRNLTPKTFAMSVDFKKGLIDGYLSVDGNNEATIHTESKSMVRSLNMLGASLGFVTIVSENTQLNKRSKNVIYDVIMDQNVSLSQRNRWFKKYNKIWVKISNIKKAPRSTGYCFEVIGDEPMFTIATTGLLTHNCRLKLDTSQLNRRGGGLFGAGSLVGSLGVVTINMPRIGYLAKNEDDFFNRLSLMLEKSKNLLITKSEFVEERTKKGMYPYSKYYLRNIYKRFGRYWYNHFLTIGIIGVNEACINMFNETIENEKGYKFAQKILDFINNKLIQYQKETDYLFNLEASPSEGTSYDLWSKDKELYPDMPCFSKSNNQFYTNSTFLPVDSKFDLFKALSHQENLQEKYTGGTVFHGFLGESIKNPNVVKNLIKTVLTSYKVPYFNITPTFSICEKHGYINGEHQMCPKCNNKTLVYSRVVGYFRPTDNFNVGKLDEYNKRTLYDKDVLKN